MTHHRRITPSRQHEAAFVLGRMEADGLLPAGEAARTMKAIVRVARQNAPDIDAKGLRMRLVHSARDAYHSRVLDRQNVETAVRWAARPLIKHQAPANIIMEAAMRAAGDLLTEPELRVILADEWDRQHRRGRR